MSLRGARYRQFGIEIDRAYEFHRKDDRERTWRHLERAHILSQSSVWRHVGVHVAMFIYALVERNWKEALGQIPRILLAAPSSLFSLAPQGNSGGSDLGLFETRPLPLDLKEFFK